jgi:hypothetical protein
MGFNVLLLREDFLCLFFRFLARFLRFLSSESELSDEDVSSLVDELSLVSLDDELVVSEDEDPGELEVLEDEDEDSSGEFFLLFLSRFLRLFRLGFI